MHGFRFSFWGVALVCGAAAMVAGCAAAPGKGALADAPVAPTSACVSESDVLQWGQAYVAKRPLPNLPVGLTAADAACTRARFQKKLAALHGPLAGYKVALTHPKMQQSFGTQQPVWGGMYQLMLLPNQSTVEAAYGARPVYEATVGVRVKDAGINQATTPEEVLAHIDQIAPMIDLADWLVQTPSKLTGNAIVALNAGTRLAILGDALRVPADARQQKKLVRELDSMSVRVIANRGRQLAQGKASDVPGHPLSSVVWLAGALRTQGQALQPGQWVSLGALSPMLRPQKGQTISVVFPGLTGARPVSVTFK